MQSFLNPSSLVIVGASTNRSKLGYVLATNVLNSGYPGNVHLVNPKGGTLLGKVLLPSITHLPEKCDLAILLLPAHVVPNALEECARNGVRAAIIASGGFRESGVHGEEMEMRCLDVARKNEIRLLGPNCVGVLTSTIPLNATFLSPPGPSPGSIAFVSQSGAMCAIATDWSRSGDMGFSWLVSTGNELDVSVGDWLKPLGEDPATAVIALYLESIKNGRQFVNAASVVSRRKPIVALKVGRTQSGMKAAMSHTGALAGKDRLYQAAFDRCGIIRADTSEQLFSWSRVLEQCAPVRGNRVAILTNAGGPGVMAADVLSKNGLSLAEPSEESLLRIRSVLPDAAVVGNPVDMLASATPEQYAECLKVLLADNNVDSVVVLLPPPPVSTAGAIARGMIPVMHRNDKPVVVALLGGPGVEEAAEHLRAARIPIFWSPESAVEGIGILEKRRIVLERLETANQAPEKADGAKKLLLPGREGSTDGTLPSDDVYKLLLSYNIPVVDTFLVSSPQHAEETARALGFPVVLKLEARGITHKAKMGGVLLNIGSPEGVRSGFDRLRALSDQNLGESAFVGVLVQPMENEGVEGISGAISDDVFGPVVMFGEGGSDVEDSSDIAFALAPVLLREAKDLIAQTAIGRRLLPRLHPGQFEDLAIVVAKLGTILVDHPEIREIELNPIRITSDRLVALDFRAGIS